MPLSAQPSPECVALIRGCKANDYDVMAYGIVAAAVLGKPLGGHSPTAITPTHGYEATRSREGGVRKELLKTGRSALGKPADAFWPRSGSMA
jgi:hypothetical protein